MKMTIELDLTIENLERLKAFCQETGAMPTSAPAPTTAPKAAPKTPAKAAAPAPKEEPKTEAPAPVTMTDVRAVALKLSKAGQQAKLKEIFAKYGATKLSEVKADDYAALMEDLTNAC